MSIANAWQALEQTMKPEVSVIIPTYNRSAFLAQAIQSVLNQTFTEFELIVVDDGSTDDTPQLVASITDSRVRYFRQTNQGRSIARNSGADLAEGTYLCFLDSDDLYPPAAIAAHLAAFNQSPGLGMTIGAIQTIDEHEQPLGGRKPWQNGGDFSLTSWLFDCYAIPGSIMIKKDWFIRSGGFDRQCEVAEDWALFIQLAFRGCPMGWTHHTVCCYRIHAQNSIKTLSQHYIGSCLALTKLFQAARDPSLLQIQNRAFGWLEVVFAKRSLLSESPELSIRYLETALKYDPGLARKNKIHTLEYLLSSIEDLDPAIEPILVQLLALLHASRGDIRKARARVELRDLYQALENPGYENVVADLIKIIRLDLTWMFNRGIVAMLVKGIVARMKPA